MRLRLLRLLLAPLSLVLVPAAHAVTAPARALDDDRPSAIERLALPLPAVLGPGAVALPAATAPDALGEALPRGAAVANAARERASADALATWAGAEAARLYTVRVNDWTGLPHRLFGPPISILADGERGVPGLNDARSVEGGARAWLFAHTALWAGDDRPRGDQLALAKAQRVGRTWFLVFQQRHEGLEVEGGRVDLRVRDDGALVLFGSDWLPGVAVDTRQARFSRGVSDARARTAVGFDSARDRALGGERVVLPWPRPDGGLDYRLVDRVRVRISDPPALWRSYVDANSGEILARENDLRYDTLVGQITAKVHPATPSDPFATVPLRDDVVGSALDSAYTAPDGRYSLAGISAGTPIRCGLSSSRRPSESPNTPYFVVAYACRIGDATNAADDATLTTCPPTPRATIGGTK